MTMTAAGDPAFDVVIAGGGMIGATLALALAPLKLRVAVVEAVDRSDGDQPSFDDRSTALSRSTQRMYEAMGLWGSIAKASTPVTRLHVSDRGRFGFSHIDAAQQGVEALGYIVINRVLGQVLQRALAASDTVDVFCPAKVVELGAESGRCVAVVETSRGRGELSGRLLVAADGARSALRDMLGIGVRHTSYGQTAIVGNVLTERPLANCAYERFTESGPFALLPLTEGRAGFVWTVKDADAAAAMALDDPAFIARLHDVFGNRVGAFSRAGRRAAYPLALSRALRLTARRAVLVGNAAHGLHPVAAQGFNLGLRDVATLCDCIADNLRSAYSTGEEADPGCAQVLDRYAEWRRRDQQKLVGFTDGLVRLFGHSALPVRLLRNAGMLGFDLVPGVRSAFARHTMGLAGHLPRLSRGVPIA